MQWSPGDVAFVAYRGCTRFLLTAPYFFHFATAVRGLSASEFGLITAVYYVATVVLEVPSGVLADRLGRRRLLVLGAFANLLGFGALGLAHDLPTFVLAEVLVAAGTATVSGADSAWLFDRLTAEGREADYARIEGAGYAAWLLSTAVAMPLADLYLVRDGDPTLTVWVTMAAQLVGLGIALGLHEPPRLRSSSREITRGALRTVARVPGVARWIVAGVGVFVLTRAAIVLIYNPWLGEAGVPVSRWGTLLAVINTVGGLAAWQAWRVGQRPEHWMLAMAAALVAMYAGIAATRAPPAALLFCIQGMVLGVYPVAMRALLNARIDDPRHRATVLSIESLACRLAFATTALAFGGLLEGGSLGAAILAVILLGVLPIAWSRAWPDRTSPGSRPPGASGPPA